MEDWKVGRAHLLGDGDNWFADGFKNREVAGGGIYGKAATQASWSRWDPTPQFSKPKLRPYSSVNAKHELWPRQEHPHLLR